jgi:hypothetical protein
MLEECRSILKNNVWDIKPRPKDKSMVSSKWIYKIKHVTDGSVEKFKARFVARSFLHLFKSLLQFFGPVVSLVLSQVCEQCPQL